MAGFMKKWLKKTETSRKATISDIPSVVSDFCDDPDSIQTSTPNCLIDSDPNFATKVKIPSVIQDECANIPSNQESSLIDLVPENSPVSKKRKIMKLNKFCDGWLKIEEFKGWLEKSSKTRKNSELAYCRICDCHITSHKTEIMRHKDSTKHQNSEKVIVSNKNIVDVVSKHSTSDNVKRAEIKMAAFIAENNLPFQLMDKLVPLCKNIFPDSPIASQVASKRTKTTNIIKKSVGNNFLEDLYSKLRIPGNFFSVVMDETTDQSAVKQCALIVIYIDDAIVKTRFFDMFEVKSGSAEWLYKNLKNCILSKKIPLENLVGFSSDTTNVMVGEHNSIFSHLKREFPDIACIKCSCHMIHLAASKACLKLPRHVEDLLRNIGSHFSRSYGRQLAFVEFQEFFQVEIHKILSPSTTRWLSLKQCVDIVLEQYQPLLAYVRQTSFDDPSHTLVSMLDTMENKFTKVYLEFMSYVLEKLCDFNKLFQSEEPLLHKVKPEVEKLLKDICMNFMDVKYVKVTPILKARHDDLRLYIQKNEIYLGILAHETIAELQNNPQVQEKDIDHFYITIQNFYIELVTVIKNKFDFSDNLFSIVSIADPQMAQNSVNQSLQCVTDRFSVLRKFVNSQKLDNEWKNYSLLDYNAECLDPSKAADIYWKKVFHMKTATGLPAFPNLQFAINLLLILPFSNASVERIFSTLKNTKTCHRNRLKTDTLVALLATKEGVKECNGCVGFEPTAKMLKAKLWN